MDFPKKNPQKPRNFIHESFNSLKVVFTHQVSATDNGESFQDLVADNQHHCAIYWNPVAGQWWPKITVLCRYKSNKGLKGQYKSNKCLHKRRMWFLAN